MVIHQNMMNRAHVWGWHEKPQEGSQQQQHSHHQPPNFIVSQTSLPELLAHGQQKTEEAECFAKALCGNSSLRTRGIRLL